MPPVLLTIAGDVALLLMLVVLPAMAIAAAVIDHVMASRRKGAWRPTASSVGGFPVIAKETSKSADAPQAAETRDDASP